VNRGEMFPVHLWAQAEREQCYMIRREFGLGAWQWLGRIQQHVVVASMVLCLGAVLIQVVLRTAVRTSLFGSPEIAIMSAWWLYLIGASTGAWERSHIKAEVLHVAFQNNARRLAVVRVISDSLTVSLSIVATHWALIYFIRAFEIGRRSFYLRIPWTYAQVSLAIGFVLMSFYFLIELADHILQLRGKRPIEPYLKEVA